MGVPLLFTEEFELVIMIAAATEEMHGLGRVPDLRGLQGEPWLVGTEFFQLERNGAFLKADAEVYAKNLTTPTLSESAIITPTTVLLMLGSEFARFSLECLPRGAKTVDQCGTAGIPHLDSAAWKSFPSSTRTAHPSFTHPRSSSRSITSTRP